MQRLTKTSRTRSSLAAQQRRSLVSPSPQIRSGESISDSSQIPRLLVRTEPGTDPAITWPTWTIAPGIEPTKGLKRAALVFEWMERYLVVRLKDVEDRAVAPLRLNTVQQILAHYVADCWHRGLPVKCMVPKARQMGISTFWQALGFALCELQPGYHVGLVAHDEEGAREIFSKVRTFLRNLEWETDLTKDQAYSVEWGHESGVRAGTIKSGDALFKGPTLSMLHWSEAANFNDRGNDADGAVASAKGAVYQQSPLYIEVFESTAKGKDAFYWARCEQARDPSSGSDFTLVFLPWFLQKEYALSWTKYRQMFLDRGKDDPGEEFKPTAEELNLREQIANVVVRPHEIYFRYRHDLTDEQLIWRRYTMANVCASKPDLFKRYFPATYEEAFIASASCMFDPATIAWYRQRAHEALATGNVLPAGPQTVFESTIRGKVRVWEMPIPGNSYVIGADIGGELKKSDPSCAYVVDKERLKVVAILHGHFEWDHYADHLYELGKFFNYARIVVESNFNPAVAKHLHRREYPNLYYYFDDVAGGKGRVPGFNTNIKTRPEMLARLDMVCRRQQFENPDPVFPNEMETFVWVPKQNNSDDGVYKAVGANNDDRIIAAALALVECELEEKDPDWKPPPERKHPWQIFWERYMAKHAAEKPAPINLSKPLRMTDAA